MTLTFSSTLFKLFPDAGHGGDPAMVSVVCGYRHLQFSVLGHMSGEEALEISPLIFSGGKGVEVTGFSPMSNRRYDARQWLRPGPTALAQEALFQ